MESLKSREIFNQYKDLVPSDKQAYLKSKLDNAKDESYDNLLIVKTYNPILVLVMSIFFGGIGIDRFIIGDIGLGICKLLFGALTFGIWPFVDIFLTYKKAKEKNLQNIITSL